MEVAKALGGSFKLVTPAPLDMLVDWCFTALSAQTGYIVPQEYEIYLLGRRQTHNKTMKQDIKLKKS